MLSLIHRLLRNLINSIQFNSDGFSNENLSSAFPNRLDFNRIRKKAASSNSQSGYKIIADWNNNQKISHKLNLFLIDIMFHQF